MVCVLLMPNSLSRAAQRSEVNCLPLSDVIVDGTLNLAIQTFTCAHAQDSAVILSNAIASGHRVKQLTI